MFQLHPRLEADTRAVTRLALCRVLLMNDRRFPWLILVPERADVREIHQLSPADRATLIEEIAQVAQTMERQHQAHKMNVAALGNQVPQLHVHIIARFTTDPAWPTPIWGKGAPQPYDAGEIETVVATLRRALGV
jgi:diadenosine tetraphosphate (Ap4A) HIT family hydrolase